MLNKTQENGDPLFCTCKIEEGNFVLLCTWWPNENSYRADIVVLWKRSEIPFDCDVVAHSTRSSNYERDPSEESLMRDLHEAIDGYAIKQKIYSGQM